MIDIHSIFVRIVMLNHEDASRSRLINNWLHAADSLTTSARQYWNVQLLINDVTPIRSNLKNSWNNFICGNMISYCEPIVITITMMIARWWNIMCVILYVCCNIYSQERVTCTHDKFNAIIFILLCACVCQKVPHHAYAW